MVTVEKWSLLEVGEYSGVKVVKGGLKKLPILHTYHSKLFQPDGIMD